MAIAAYIDELMAFDPDAVETACARWARTNARFPWLAELLGEVREISRQARNERKRLAEDAATKAGMSPYSPEWERFVSEAMRTGASDAQRRLN